MTAKTDKLKWVTLALDLSADAPLYRRLYESLRRAILNKQLVSGTRLPSSRALAAELEVSRNTVLTAFEQLLAEGYLEGRRGSGTYVSSALPEEFSQAEGLATRLARHSQPAATLSKRGARLAATQFTATAVNGTPRAFRVGTPALDAFPFDLWTRMLLRQWRRASSALLEYDNAAGHPELREAIAGYLRGARAVNCAAEQVIVVSGAQQALALAARVLLDPGDAVLIEDPGYPGARAAFSGAGLKLIPAPVDEAGIDISAAVKRHRKARAVYVTPSHQFPLGVTMSLARRLELLDWAARSGAWILEDDYDSEFRYAGRPIPALQGLDSENHVIYLGTFSKVLFPALRLGYMVVPHELVNSFAQARKALDGFSRLMDQAALRDFINEGHLTRHIRRMRVLYADRQAALVKAAARELSGLLEVGPADAGMHLVGWLPEGIDDWAASQRACALGVEAQPLSWHCLNPAGLPRSGLLLGYAAIDEKQINRGVRQLKLALQTG